MNVLRLLYKVIGLAWIGIITSTGLGTPDETSAQGQSPGLIVVSVYPGSLAEKCGIKIGDRLIIYDHKILTSPAALSAARDMALTKKEVALHIYQDSEVKILTISSGTLGLGVEPVLPATAQSYFNDAKKFLQNNKPTDAFTQIGIAAKISATAREPTVAAWLWQWLGDWHYFHTPKKLIEAKRAYLQALGPAKLSDDLALKSEILSRLAIYARDMDDLNTAIHRFEESLRLDEKAGNEWWQMGDLEEMWRIALDLNQFDKAEKYVQRVLTLKKRFAQYPRIIEQQPFIVAVGLNDAGVVAVVRGDVKKAREHFEQALAIEDKPSIPESIHLAMVLDNLGMVLVTQGDISGGRVHVERAQKIFESQAPDSLDAAYCMDNLAKILNLQGNPKDARPYAEHAQKVFDRLAPNSPDAAKNLMNLGHIARQEGNLRAAQDYFDWALAIHPPTVNDSLTVADILFSLADIALDVGDLDWAYDYAKRSLRVYEKLTPDSLQVGESFMRLGIVFLRIGKFQSARYCLQRAKTILNRHAPESSGFAMALSNLGSIAHAENNFAAAQRYYTDALSIQRRRLPDSLEVATTLRALGQIAHDQKRFGEAKNRYKDALRICTALAPDSWHVAEVLNGMGKVALAEKDLSQAEAHFISAVKALEAQRSRIGGSSSRQIFSGQYSYVYANLVRTQHELG